MELSVFRLGEAKGQKGRGPTEWKRRQLTLANGCLQFPSFSSPSRSEMELVNDGDDAVNIALLTVGNKPCAENNEDGTDDEGKQPAGLMMSIQNGDRHWLVREDASSSEGTEGDVLLKWASMLLHAHGLANGTLDFFKDLEERRLSGQMGIAGVTGSNSADDVQVGGHHYCHQFGQRHPQPFVVL